MTNSKKKTKPANRDKQGRFKPGHSGNPSGRPAKEDTLRYWLVEFLKAREEGHDKIRMQELAEKIVLEAFKGDKNLMKEVFDRVDGKAPETIRHEGELDVNVKRIETIIDELFDDEKRKTSKNKDAS